MKNRKGQTIIEYILLLAVVVALSYVLKTPMQNFLGTQFGAVSGRAVAASSKPMVNNYVNQDSKGCSAVGGNMQCE